MTNRLTVHTATIHTATIEIKTLTLNGKQVTLSVFRQLYEQTILDNELRPTHLLGAGWGWVNYCPGSPNCAWARQGIWPHHHLVWQLGEELRRCALPVATGVYPSLVDVETFAALYDLPQLFIAV